MYDSIEIGFALEVRYNRDTEFIYNYEKGAPQTGVLKYG